MTAVLEIVASGFIRLDFAREMEAGASNEEMALEEMSQYPSVASYWSLSLSLLEYPLFYHMDVSGLFQIPQEHILIPF